MPNNKPIIIYNGNPDLEFKITKLPLYQDFENSNYNSARVWRTKTRKDKEYKNDCKKKEKNKDNK